MKKDYSISSSDALSKYPKKDAVFTATDNGLLTIAEKTCRRQNGD